MFGPYGVFQYEFDRTIHLPRGNICLAPMIPNLTLEYSTLARRVNLPAQDNRELNGARTSNKSIVNFRCADTLAADETDMLEMTSTTGILVLGLGKDGTDAMLQNRFREGVWWCLLPYEMWMMNC